MVEKMRKWADFFDPDSCYKIINDDKEFQIKYWNTEPAFHHRTPINDYLLDCRRIHVLAGNTGTAEKACRRWEFNQMFGWMWSNIMRTWWRHQMKTFSVLLALCAGNSPVPGEFPAQRPVTRSFDVHFDLRPNKRLSKQSWGWWFETSSRPLYHAFILL